MERNRKQNLVQSKFFTVRFEADRRTIKDRRTGACHDGVGKHVDRTNSTGHHSSISSMRFSREDLRSIKIWMLVQHIVRGTCCADVNDRVGNWGLSSGEGKHTKNPENKKSAIQKPCE